MLISFTATYTYKYCS